MKFRIRKKHEEFSERNLSLGTPAIAKFILGRIVKIKKNKLYPKSFGSYEKFEDTLNKLEKGFNAVLVLEKYENFDDTMLKVINSIGFKATHEDMSGYNLLILNQKHKLHLISCERYNELEKRSTDAFILFTNVYRDLIKLDESINPFMISFIKGLIGLEYGTPIKYTDGFGGKHDYSQYLDIMKLDEDERWEAILKSILRAFELSNYSLYIELSVEEKEQVEKGFYYLLDNKNSLYV